MKYFFSFLFIVVIIGITIGQTVIILDTPGSGTWPVPPGVSAITVEVWGAGGGGGQYEGGGGGGYSKEENYPVTCGTNLNYYIGTGGQGGGGGGSESTVGVTANPGEDSDFEGLVAYGGAADLITGGGGGGASSASSGSGNNYGEGTTENGEPGVLSVDGGYGGKAGGLEGGIGGDPNGVSDGAAPGGGGSMAPPVLGPSGIGGKGGNGRIKLTILSTSYQTVADGDFFDPAVWVGGCVPPNPIPANLTISISHALTNVGSITNYGTIIYTSVVPFLNSGSYQGSGIFQGSFQNMGTISPSSN